MYTQIVRSVCASNEHDAAAAMAALRFAKESYIAHTRALYHTEKDPLTLAGTRT